MTSKHRRFGKSVSQMSEKFLKTVISDMSGPTLIQLLAGMAFSGTPQTRVLKPTGATVLPGGGDGLTVSEAARREAASQFLKG